MSTWRKNVGSGFMTKSSKHGEKYKCKHCGKETLGTTFNEKMHWKTCVTLKKKEARNDQR
jgi:hypothetical protein